MSKNYLINGCVLNFSESLVIKSLGQRENLKKNQILLLKTLINAYPEIVSVDDIKEQVWGHTFISNESVTQLIKKTRTSIDDQEKTVIINHKGEGYSISSVTEQDETNQQESAALLNQSVTKGDRGENNNLSKSSHWSWLTALYFTVSIIGWVVIAMYLYKSQATFDIQKLPDLTQSHYTVVSNNEAGITLRYEDLTCRLNFESFEAWCEKNNH
ncbi:hypothetical protein HGP28_02770 [Vibrio sp. SM6]|uniref:OmpR/PhoB-type domain-containing protein n=1 Tax=Vibrio agarilyticus TaxID=2726741 RepID=A0A7X8YFZ3_9VIBR|nr:winged helix-turn-helix domain-containing protein [Vibrio agarilyticus]NLS11812.1 hypothetical protein [Vibrio agarilyticus]